MLVIGKQGVSASCVAPGIGLLTGKLDEYAIDQTACMCGYSVGSGRGQAKCPAWVTTYVMWNF